MRVLRTILRHMLLSPTGIAAVDDQRTWRGIDMLIGAMHVAKAIKQASNRDKIGLMLPTAGIFPMSLLATWMLGRTAVPLNYLLKPEELSYVINDAELDLVVTVTPLIEHMKSPAGGGSDLPASIKQIRLDQLSFKGFPPLRWPKGMSEDDLAVLLYTSGTSGKPKGVMLTAANLHANVNQCVQYVGFTNKDVLLGVLPQFHSFGLTVLTLLPLTVGAKVVYTARFLPKRIVDLIKTHRPTGFMAIPSMYNALLTTKSATAEDFASLKYVVSGAEPLPEAVFDGFRERFNITLNEGYGLTETSPVTNWCRPHEFRRKSVGKPLPGIEEIIVKDETVVARRHGTAANAHPAQHSTREPVPDTEGEIRIKGPNVMKGYFKLPEQTAAVFDANGYFKTGDMGRFDADGHLYITGRIKEMLIIGGENVFPREIEEVLDAHASVLASAVIGVMDESRGEVPVAFVELKEGATFDETALRSFCRERLAQFKVPRDIRHIEKLPRNPTGKLLRRELKALV